MKCLNIFFLFRLPLLDSTHVEIDLRGWIRKKNRRTVDKVWSRARINRRFFVLRYSDSSPDVHHLLYFQRRIPNSQEPDVQRARGVIDLNFVEQASQYTCVSTVKNLI